MSDRVDWFFRQQVTQAELDGAFDDLEAADRAVVADILGAGFLQKLPTVTNLVTEQTPNDLTILVQRLLGYDQQGRRLTNEESGFQGGNDLGAANPTQIVDLSTDEVGAPTTVAAPGNSKIISVFVEFTRRQQDPRLDGNQTNLFFDLDESVQFNVVQSAEAVSPPAPPLRPDQLLLCDVTRAFGQTTFVNANISQARREDFVLSLSHGPSHPEAGADPIPNAHPVVGEGGLLSGVDKIKLDGIDFTASGIGALFPTQAALEQRANILAAAATSQLVTTEMAGKNPGGDNVTAAVVTAAPHNRVELLRENGDSFTRDPDGTVGENDKIFGRLTEAAGAWTLSFFYLDEATGAETPFDMTPYAGQTIQWWTVETYTLDNLPTFGKGFGIPSDQLAAEFPFPIKAQDNGGSDIGAFSHVRAGANVTLADIGGGILQVNGASVTGTVPVGAIVPWWRPNTTDPIPTDYLVCDGQTVADAGSPFNGQAVPNLQDRFLRGLNNASIPTYGGPAAPPAAGADNHSHGGNTNSNGGHSHNVNSHSHDLSGMSSAGSHNHSGGQNPSVAQGNTGLGPGELLFSFADRVFTMSNAGTTHTHGGNTGGAGATTDNQGNHSHGVATNSGANVPAHLGLIFIIKIK